MKVAKKIFGIIINIIMILVFIVMIFAISGFIQINFQNKEYVDYFGYTYFQIKTGSMSGTLEIGDIVIVKFDENVSKEDIISFKEQDYIVTHRVMEVDGDEIITKGDANNVEDEPINKNEIIGKVVKTIPNLKIWADVFKTKEVYISLVITIILFIITFSIDTKKTKEDTVIINTERLTEEKNEEKKE